MISARHNPRSREDLFSIVKGALVGARVAVAQAGHFLLYEDEADGRAVPCMESELTAPRYQSLSQEFGRFPHMSWRLAGDLMDALNLNERYLLVLVNDWQYVPTKSVRDAFYREQPQLPEVYRGSACREIRLLTPHGPAGFDETSPFFSERALRNQFHRRLKKLTGSEELPENLKISRTQAGATCSVEVMGQMQEVYCSTKSADCSGEVAQLLDDSHRLVGCDAFINFVPSVCQTFVDLGSELPAKLFGTPIRRVINVSLPATHIASEQDMLAEASVTVHTL
jgi:hypothetical protein